MTTPIRTRLFRAAAASVIGLGLAVTATAAQASSLWGSFVLDEVRQDGERAIADNGLVKVDIYQETATDGAYIYRFHVYGSGAPVALSEFGFSMTDDVVIDGAEGVEQTAGDADFGGFGRPAYQVRASSGSTDDLEFSVTTTVALDLARLNGGDYFFAARTAPDSEGKTKWVGGGVGVPLPAAAWLFGSALIAFGAVSGRRVIHGA